MKENSHTGGESSSCSWCTKSFGLAHHLHRHLRLHTGEKPYSCPQCSWPFAASGYLRQLMKIHTGKKPYNCLHCSKTFRASKDLQEHFTLVRNRTAALVVLSCFPGQATCGAILKDTQARNSTAVPSVQSRLSGLVPCTHSRFYIFEKPGELQQRLKNTFCGETR